MLTAILLLASGAVAQHAPPPQRFLHERPNVVLFLADDISRRRVDLMRAQGLLPNYDRAAALGTEFRRGYSHAMCAPTRAMLMTHRWAPRNAGFACDGAPVAGQGVGATASTLVNSTDTLGRALLGAGYFTAYRGRWGLGTWWNDHGGDESFADAPGLYGWASARAVQPDGGDSCGGAGYFDWLRVDDGDVSYSDEYSTTAIVDEGIAFIEEGRPDGWVLVVALNGAHLPFHWPPPSAMPPGWVQPPFGFDELMYQAMVRSVDFALGRLLDAIDLNTTLLIVSADNGDPQQVPPSGYTANEVKFSVADGGVGVTLIALGLGFPAGQQSFQPVSLIDVTATCADLAGQCLQLGTDQGQSIVPALDGHPLQRQWVYASNGNDHAVVHANGWKLREIGGVQRFFDLNADPLEDAPKTEAQVDPAVVSSLRAALAEATAP